jgi:beta-lactamase regulating signal transducer with metallopeptidase domain
MKFAHLERYDDWSNLIQRILIVLNPFNPFLWLVGNELEPIRASGRRRLLRCVH